MKLAFDAEKNLHLSPLRVVMRRGEKRIENVDISGPRYYEGTDLAGMSWMMIGDSPGGEEIEQELICAADEETVAFLWVPEEAFSAAATPLCLTIVGTLPGQRIKITGDGPVIVQEG